MPGPPVRYVRADMSATSKKSTAKGKRYSDAQKQEVVAYVNKVNAEQGRGGQAAAVKKYGISVLSIAGWLKAAGAAKGKPVKGAKAAAKPAKKAGKKKSPQGKRYSDEQKREVLAFLSAVNTKKGRGGLSAASKKYRISPLTITSWIKKSGVKVTKPAAAKPAKAPKAPRAKGGLSAKGLAALGAQVAKAEKQLAKLKTMIESIKVAN